MTSLTPTPTPTPARPPRILSEDTRPTPLRDSPFAFTRPAKKRGVIDRMMKRARPDLAAQALQHLLARRDPKAISQTQISDLLIEYGLAGRQARSVLTAMWRRVLETFLADNKFCDREIAYLEALRNALALTDAEMADAERAVIHPRYEVAVRDAMSDDRISTEEREMLERLGRQLRLPEPTQRDIHQRSAKRTLETRLRASVEDRRLSPAELEQLTALARHLGIDRRFDASTEAMLDRFALFWRVENGDIPEVVATVPVDADEHCHFECAGTWYAPPTSSLGDAEGVGSVRIARGVYYRSASVSSDLLRTDQLVRVGTGRFLVTSRHVIFDGERQHVAIPLRKLGAFQIWGDALTLEKNGSPLGHVVLEADTELAAVILSAALARA